MLNQTTKPTVPRPHKPIEPYQFTKQPINNRAKRNLAILFVIASLLPTITILFFITSHFLNHQ